MAGTLLVIGWRTATISPPTSLMNEVAHKVTDSDACRVRRCYAPSSLASVVAEVAARYGAIDRLDLYDHGSAGYLRMGDDQLFRSDDSATSPLLGAAVAAALRPYLAPAAVVRLLGCDTAVGPTGRMMLVKLARALGEQRTAVGTIDTTDATDFGTTGFKSSHEAISLFASTAAVDGIAPTPDERRAHLLEIRPGDP